MTVQVYMNIRKFNKGEPCWSIRDKKTGKVIRHEHEVVLTDCYFTVQPAGRNRVRAQQRKNVHAWVTGTITDGDDLTVGPQECVHYNPYKQDHFELVSRRKAIACAEVVHLSEDGKIYVYGKTKLLITHHKGESL